MNYFKQYFSVFLIVIVNSVFSQNNEKTMGTNYYSISDGNYSANIWSTTCHTCATCNCAPACNIPANNTIYIKHNVTSTCTTLDIGSNSTFILSNGGSFSLLGNGSITGTGSLTVNNGSSLSVTGNLALSGSGAATINGTVSVSGTLSIGNNSDVCGGGNLSAGAMTGSADCGGVPFGNLSVLPIELIDFSGNCLTNGVQLNWSTASELNNDYFLMEKSSNGIDWELVSKIGGNGTSNSVHNYIYTDINVNSEELTYYRMSQVDLDGRTAILKMIDINCNNNIPDKMIFYPNPASTELNIHLDVKEPSTNGIIRLINNFGQTIMETKVDLTKGINSFIYPVDFEPGTYTILFASDNVIVPSQQLVVIR